MNNFHVTLGSADDLDLILEHWLSMWKDVHPERETDLESQREFAKKWFTYKFLNSQLALFISGNSEGDIAGSGSVLIREDWLRPSTRLLFYPYILSLYTAPEFRRMGVASKLVKSMLAWSREKGYDRVELHSSLEGRKLLVGFGFKNTSEMFLKLST